MSFSKDDFLKIDKKKLELSVRTLKPYLIYLEKKYNKTTMREFVEDTCMDADYLINQNNWISFEYMNMFLQKMVDYTKNENIFYDAGVYLLSKEAYGSIYSILSVFKLFGSPRATYKKIFELNSNYTNIGEFQLIKAKKGKVTCRYIIYNNFKQTKLNCESIKGQLVSVPQFWNLPRAKVKEIKCATDGGNECIYEFSWPTGSSKKFIFPIGVIVIMLIELVLFFFNKLPWFGIKDIIISGFIFSTIAFLERNISFKKFLKENKALHQERSKVLEKSLRNSKKEYKQLKEANLRIFEVVNKLTILNFIAEEIFLINNETELIKKVLNITIGCINFDRGYCIFLDDRLKMKRPAAILDIRKSRKARDVMDVNLSENMDHFQKSLEEQTPNLTKIAVVDHNPVVSIIVAFTLRKNNYIIGFDNYISKKPIKQNKLLFFSTIISQIKLALENIHAAEAAHNILLRIPSSIIVFSQKTMEVTYVNNAYLSSYEGDQIDVMGQNVLDLLNLTEMNRAIFIENIDQANEKSYVDYQEMLVNGQVLGYSLFVIPDNFKGQSEIGMVMKDITKHKELQDQLLRSEKLVALGTLASGVAHEINNPLYGVLGTAEVIVDEAESPDVKKMAEDIIDFTMQVSDIVKDLSSYSRSIREEKPGDVDVNEVVDEALRIIRYSPTFVNIEIEKNFKEVPSIFALKGEISQIFMNLMKNSVQAMDGKGKLIITTCYENKFIKVTIQDSGPGIPPEYLTKLFDPFFTTKPTGEGTGLGLNIVYRLVVRYNGYIHAGNSKDSGAIFTIELPIREDE